MFKYSLDNKRYHTFNYFLKNKFGGKVIKVPLDINSPCPNEISGGCIYCAHKSKANIIIETDDIIKQFNHTKNILLKKWPKSIFIPYFQSGTNTYLPVDKVKPLIDKLLCEKNVVGIAIATRPDCINDQWYKYLSDLNKKTFLTIEIGLQTCNENTLKFINRNHTVTCVTNAITRLKSNNIFTVVHIINGLPHETKEDMLNTIKYLNRQNIDAIKIHMLYIDKDTKLAKIYQKEKFHVLTKEEYIDIICQQLEYLNPNIVIERITGDPIKDDLIAPKWLLKKCQLLNDIDKEMVKRNIYQGDKTGIKYLK